MFPFQLQIPLWLPSECLSPALGLNHTQPHAAFPSPAPGCSLPGIACSTFHWKPAHPTCPHLPSSQCRGKHSATEHECFRELSGSTRASQPHLCAPLSPHHPMTPLGLHNILNHWLRAVPLNCQKPQVSCNPAALPFDEQTPWTSHSSEANQAEQSRMRAA